MTLHFHTPHAMRWLRMNLRAGHRRIGNSPTVVLAIGVLSLVAFALHVLDAAASRKAVEQRVLRQVSVVDADDFDRRADGAAASACFLEVPTATAEAISL
jgi:hypothetical protein